MHNVMIEISDTNLQLLNLSIEAFVEELRLITARQFYQKNHLSLDIAAQLAGLSTDEFSSKIIPQELSINLQTESKVKIVPSSVSAKIEPSDIYGLAQQQGVEPIKSMDALKADFWPEEESVDDFIKTIRTWRDESLTLERELPDD